MTLPEVPREQHKAAFVFGNEKSGLTDMWVREADACVAIPSSGFTGSLNLSVAVAITIYDRLMGTAHNALPHGTLDDDERRTLRQEWYEKLAHGSDEVRARYQEFLDDPPAATSVFPVDSHGAPRT